MLTSRLEVAKNTLFLMGENCQGAESRIRDADMACESADLVKTRILQEVGASISTQANNAPAVALKLLWEREKTRGSVAWIVRSGFLNNGLG